MTNLADTRPAAAQDLDNASLDLVVRAGIMVPEATGDTSSARKQEHNEKLAAGGQP